MEDAQKKASATQEDMQEMIRLMKVKMEKEEEAHEAEKEKEAVAKERLEEELKTVKEMNGLMQTKAEEAGKKGLLESALRTGCC
eukprot:m.12878 g.12878  ORF g.12878 m.12878 type:complete len:84 (+) comp24361_c0_seq1:1166-1417(+)